MGSDLARLLLEPGHQMSIVPNQGTCELLRPDVLGLSLVLSRAEQSRTMSVPGLSSARTERHAVQRKSGWSRPSEAGLILWGAPRLTKARFMESTLSCVWDLSTGWRGQN